VFGVGADGRISDRWVSDVRTSNPSIALSSRLPWMLTITDHPADRGTR